MVAQQASPAGWRGSGGGAAGDAALPAVLHPPARSWLRACGHWRAPQSAQPALWGTACEAQRKGRAQAVEGRLAWQGEGRQGDHGVPCPERSAAGCASTKFRGPEPPLPQRVLPTSAADRLLFRLEVRRLPCPGDRALHRRPHRECWPSAACARVAAVLCSAPSAASPVALRPLPATALRVQQRSHQPVNDDVRVAPAGVEKYNSVNAVSCRGCCRRTPRPARFGPARAAADSARQGSCAGSAQPRAAQGSRGGGRLNRLSHRMGEVKCV